MTNPNLTLIGVVLDRSGSMAGIRAATISGFNELIDGQRSSPGEAVVYLNVFSTVPSTVHRMAPIGIVPALTEATYVPNGNTALLDAIGVAISEIGRDLDTTPAHDRPSKVVIAIITDGEENASSRYTREAIRAMIEHQRSKYAWQFLFIGANQDAITVGAHYGITAGDALTFTTTTAGTTNAYSATNIKLMSFRATNSMAPYSETDREASSQ